MELVIILFVLGIILTIIGFIRVENFKDFGFTLGMIGITALILCIIFSTEVFIVIPRKIDSFMQQKAYIESMDGGTIESAGVTQKAIDMNNSLYGMQFSKKRYGILSLYPQSILEVEPIRIGEGGI
jgi:magnesium-transporting ATPase (P-type)